MKLSPFTFWFHAVCSILLVGCGLFFEAGSDLSICRLSFGIYIMACLMHPESRAK